MPSLRGKTANHGKTAKRGAWSIQEARRAAFTPWDNFLHVVSGKTLHDEAFCTSNIRIVAVYPTSCCLPYRSKSSSGRQAVSHRASWP